MFKRFTKGISLLLVLAMLVEMLPVSLLGNLIPHVHAAEPMEAQQGYDVPAPSETDNTVTANLPATIIDETVPLEAPDAQTPDEDTPSESETPELPEITAPEPTEEDRRFLSLVCNYSQYSELSPEDADFLCAYTGISSAAFAELEAAEITLALSISYGRLAREYDCALSRIIDMAPDEDMRQALLVQITIYKAALREDLIGTALDQTLRGHLLQGHGYEQVFDAYAVSEVLGISMDALLEEDSTQPMPDSLSMAEIGKLQELAAALNVSAASIASYAAEHELTAEEIKARQEEIDRKRAELMTAPQGSGGEGSEETEAARNTFTGAPYTYNSGDSEKVALNSGALIYENTDYVLPGVNGLDLVIGRRYDSQDAGISVPDVSTRTFLHHEYYVCWGWTASYYVPGIGSGSWSYYDRAFVNGPFESRSEAQSFANSCQKGTERYPNFSDGADLILDYYAYVVDESFSYTKSTSTTKPNTYFTGLYGLGHGWSLQFSSIETVKSKKYLHLSDGSSYEVNFSGSGSHLKDYPLTDMVLDNNCQEVSNGSVSSQYRLSYQDGRREYFSSDGTLIGIQNRYGDCITLVHSVQNGYPHIVITDTLGREVVISGQSSAGGHTMTVSLPDGETLSYQVTHDGDARALASYTDAVGSTTHFSYTKQSAGFSVTSKRTDAASNTYLNLTTVTHPTSAQSIYTYATAERNLGKEGLMQVYRLSTRADRLGNEELNRQTYAYTSDCSGYPAARDPENLPSDFTYSASVTDADGVRTTVYFNNKHLQTEASIQDGYPMLQKTLYVYDEKKLPIRQTVQTYNPSNSSVCLTSVTAAEYDAKGNVTASWSAPANGDTSNTEYKSTCAYDSAYGLLLIKIWKTDENTTIRMENTLDAAKKNIIRTEVYRNDVLTGRTDYTYDSHGNVTGEKRYHDGFAAYDLIEYTYQNNAYLSQEKHSGILTADGAAAISTPGQSSGVIATNYSYDVLGRMTSSTDGGGNTTSYTYDALGNVTQVTNPDSTTVQYNRDYVNNAITVTDENGARVKYTYTPLGLEFETVDAATGKVITRKEYDGQSRLIKTSDFVYGGVTEYSYDALDRVTAETVKQGGAVLARTLYAYDDAAESGQYQKVTKTVVGDENAPSIVTTQYTDKNGNVAKTGKLLGGTEYFDTASYDYVGRAVTQLTAADAAKHLPFTAKYEYNENGQVTKTWNAENQSTTNSYDALGRLVQTTDYAGTPTTYAYDSLGRLLSQTIVIEDGVTATSKYDYDARGNIVREWKPVNAVGQAAAWSKVEYAYDSRSRLTSVKQYDGNIAATETSYTYDGVGNTLTMTAGGNTTAYTYDRFGNTLSMTDALGQTETYAYSPTGKLQTKTDRNGTITTYAYDALGRVLSVSAATDGRTDVTQTSYTLTGQVWVEQNYWQKTTYTYDELGQVIQVEEVEWNAPAEPAGFIVTLDANGGEVSPAQIEVTSDETYDLPTPTRTGYIFDGWYLGDTLIASGDPVQITENATFTAHWEESLHTITLDPNGGTVTPTVIEVIGSAVSVLPTPSRTGYTFLGWYYGEMRIVSLNETTPLPKTCTLTARWTANTYTICYSANGGSLDGRDDPISSHDLVVDGTGSTGDFIFSKDGKSMQKTYRYDQDVTLPPCPFVKRDYVFNGWGTSENASERYDAGSVVRNLTAEQGGTVTLYAIWDTQYELPGPGPDEPVVASAGAPGVMALSAGAEDTLISYTKTYTYDLAGNRTSFVLTKNGEVVQNVTYTYDNLNRLATVSENGILQASYSYDVNGNRASLTYANGVEESYAYNKANWVVRLSGLWRNQTLTSFRYTYYASGSQKSETDHTGKITSYVYDGLGRLTQESETDGLTVRYSYDAAGNRARMAVTGTENYVTSYTYDANNRLLTETKAENGEPVTTTYTYDANGNTLTESAPAHSTIYTYDGFNQLVSAKVDRLRVAYAYNARGIRTAKRVGWQKTAYLLDGGNVVAEVQNDAVTNTYLRGINLIGSRAPDEGSYFMPRYYLFNAHGDVVTTTYPSGVVNHQYDYDAFGNEENPDPTDTNPFRYCGEYLDAETGSYYLRARYYDPTIGRFTQMDSVWSVTREMPNGQRITDPLSLNLYAYCANNPIAYCDPSGHAFETILDVLGLIWSIADFCTEPSLKNAGFLLWDAGSILLPFVAGSYTAKGIKLLGKTDDIIDSAKVVDRIDDFTDAIKITNKLDDGVDVIEFISSGNRLVGSYRDMKKYTEGYKGTIQAHHLLEQRLCKALGVSIDDMISVVLTKDQHTVFTKLWRELVPYGTNYGKFAKWEDVREIARKVYADYPELFALLDGYMNSIKK